MSRSTMADTLDDELTRVHEKSARALRTGRTAVADVIDSAAAKVNAGAERVSDVARATSERLGASASWIRDTSGRDLLDDFHAMVRAHPGRTVVGAVVVGFLVGRWLRGR